MKIEIWRSFACNNSSSFRLVARFDDPKVAADVEKELTEFFAQHAREFDEGIDDPDFRFDRPLPAAVALGKKYGIKWKDALHFGDMQQIGDEPGLAVLENVLVVYHSYCGGFGKDVPTYVKKRGGKLDAEGARAWAMTTPEVTVVFKKPPGRIDKTLAPFFEPPAPKKKERVPPWSKRRYNAGDEYRRALFSDGKTVAFHWPLDPIDIAPLREWLTKNGVRSPIIELCEDASFDKIDKLKRASCDACGARPLEYLNAKLHNLESDQAACPKCGGMFDLAALVPPPSEPVVVKKKTVKKKTVTKKSVKKKAAAKKKKTTAKTKGKAKAKTRK
jgi:hypothetical protein